MTISQVALRNVRGPALHAVTLLHDYYCERGAPCHCRRIPCRTTVQDRHTGQVRQQHGDRVTCASVTIPRGKEVVMHSAVLQIPGVASAVQAGILAVREIVVQPAPIEVESTEMSPAPDPPARRRRRT